MFFYFCIPRLFPGHSSPQFVLPLGRMGGAGRLDYRHFDDAARRWRGIDGIVLRRQSGSEGETGFRYRAVEFVFDFGLLFYF